MENFGHSVSTDQFFQKKVNEKPQEEVWKSSELYRKIKESSLADLLDELFGQGLISCPEDYFYRALDKREDVEHVLATLKSGAEKITPIADDPEKRSVIIGIRKEVAKEINKIVDEATS